MAKTVTKTVTARVPEKKDKSGKVTQKELIVSVDVEMGATAKDSIELFGDEAINTNAFANWRVVLQGGMRNALRRGEAPADIQSRYAGAKMGVAQTGGKVDAEAAFKQKFMAADAKGKARLLNELKELAAAAA